MPTKESLPQYYPQMHTALLLYVLLKMDYTQEKLKDTVQYVAFLSC